MFPSSDKQYKPSTSVLHSLYFCPSQVIKKADSPVRRHASLICRHPWTLSGRQRRRGKVEKIGEE